MPTNLTDSLTVEITGSRQRKRPECFAAYEHEDGSDDEDRRHRPKKSRPPVAHDGEGGKKRMRCGTCDGCQKPNCGKCPNCKDMPKFGGKGTKRQTCEERVCELLREAKEKAAMERALEQAKGAEERARERKEARDEREVLRALERSESAKERAQLRDERLVEKDLRGMTQGRPKASLGKGKVRTPTVVLEEGMGGGWGEHTNALVAGTEVEVRLDEEALEQTVSHISPLHLPCISPVSPPHLPGISPVSPRCTWTRRLSSRPSTRPRSCPARPQAPSPQAPSPPPSRPAPSARARAVGSAAPPPPLPPRLPPPRPPPSTLARAPWP